MKKYFAYYNQYKNGIDIAFADNTLLFLSCAEAEKNLHSTPNSQSNLTEMILLLRKEKFGSSSEKTTIQIEGQLSL